MRSNRIAIGLPVMVAVGIIVAAYALWPHEEWTKDEVATLRSLWIGSLTPLPPDPSNKVGDDPRAAALGKRLFFDARLSINGNVSCASCHRPALLFQDGLPLGQGVGITTRKTMAIAGTAYSPWLFWDGRKDSQWAQALGPLESALEHAGTRAQHVQVIARHYRAEYEALFGPLPGAREAITPIFANIGKLIAAYERRIMPARSRFDAYVEAVLHNDQTRAPGALAPDEVAGLRLFIGKAQCLNCHNGPLFTDHHFHNTGVPARAGSAPDMGRATGALLVLEDEFNCASRYSDAAPEDCAELRHMVAAGPSLAGAFKPPSLRNVAQTGPYMHTGQLAALREVLEHYNRAPAAAVGHTELKPLRLSAVELAQLEAFLRSLSGGVVSPP